MITLDTDRHRVTVDGKEVMLTAIEFRLLDILLQRRGRVQSRETLLHDVWGYEKAELLNSRTVDTHVTRLRAKLGSRQWELETIRSFGYRLRGF